MNVLLVAGMLLIAGGHKRIHHDDLDFAAAAIVDACDGQGPALPPHGIECYAAIVAIWYTETRGSFAGYSQPVAEHTGVGPMQVLQPRTPLGYWNSSLGHPSQRWIAPPPATLRMPAVNFRWGVRVLRMKYAKAGRRQRWLRTFRFYNGSPRGPQYALMAKWAFRMVQRER